MDARVVLPALTSILALVFALLLFDQWRDRRGGFQLIWAFGMLFYGIGAGCEAIAARERLERGALPDLVPDRRGLDRRLAGARDGVSCWAGPGSATASRSASSSRACSRSSSATSPSTPGAGTLRCSTSSPRRSSRWRSRSRPTSRTTAGRCSPSAAVVGATSSRLVLMASTTLAAPGYALDPATGVPVATLFPPQLRLLTPFMNITGRASR